MTVRVAGIVPAAGRSSRMGSSKALLAPGGRSFLRRVAHALSAGGCDPVLVVVRDESGPEAAEASQLGLGCVLNPDPSDGPISSLRAGVRALSADVDGCAWCPVDYPLIRSETVAALVACFRGAPGSVVRPAHHGRHGHPVVFPREVFERLCDPGLAEGARTVVREHTRKVTVAVEDPGILVDVDTPEEYHRLFPDAAPRPAHTEAHGAPPGEHD